jgi:hypothetical protein
MTANGDSDRIIRVWLESMPDQAPDRVVDSVYQAVEVTPQVRILLAGRWRLTPMTRLALASGLAAIVVAAGALVILRPNGQSNVGASPPPRATSSIGATASPSASASPLPAVPAVLRQDWHADVAVDGLPALGVHEAQIQLSFSFDQPIEWIQTGFSGNAQLVQHSSAFDDGPGRVRLVSSETLGGCQFGDDAHYQWAVSGNGLYLTLTAVSDPCASRRSTLERTWVHSLAARNLGGPGVLYFQPGIRMTLPAAAWGAGGENDVYDISSDTGFEFIAVENPAGFTDPCSLTGGNHKAVPSTIAAYSAYLKTLPGFTVTSTSKTIGGDPAVHLAIKTSASANCNGGHIFEFAPPDLTSDGNWFITPGDPDSIWLVQIGRDLLLLQWLGPGVTATDEQQVLSTITFIDKLPTP